MNKNRRAIAALTISGAAVIALAGYEGYSSQAYQDIAGVWTIGFGETKGVRPGQTTTPDRAMARLYESAAEHADGIAQCIEVPITQYEYDAYLSFAYNVGVGAFCRSTLVKRLNAGDYTGACQELLKWVYAGGKLVQGLVNRRQKEYQTCTGG